MVVFGAATISGCCFTANEAVGAPATPGRPTARPSWAPAAASSPSSVRVLTVDEQYLRRQRGHWRCGRRRRRRAASVSLAAPIDVHAGTTCTSSSSVFHNNAAVGELGGSGCAGGPVQAAACRRRSSRPPPSLCEVVNGNQATGGAGGAGANGGSGWWRSRNKVGGRTIYDGADGSTVSISNSVLNNKHGPRRRRRGRRQWRQRRLGGAPRPHRRWAKRHPSPVVSDSNINANSAEGGAGGSGAASPASGVGGGVVPTSAISASWTL